MYIDFNNPVFENFGCSGGSITKRWYTYDIPTMAGANECYSLNSLWNDTILPMKVRCIDPIPLAERNNNTDTRRLGTRIPSKCIRYYNDGNYWAIGDIQQMGW